MFDINDLNLDKVEFFNKYGRNKKIGAYTLGCKVNQYETNAVLQSFVSDGYDIVDFDQVCDVYIVNTCTVTGLSDRKSRQAIGRAKKSSPGSVLCVMGCYPQVSAEDISSADIVMGSREKNLALKFVKSFADTGIKINTVKSFEKNEKYDELDFSALTERTRAYVKIQDGCRQFCTYCIIPYARGPVRSKSLANILNETKELVNKGYSEIVLTGIHIASYKDKETSLIDVLDKVTGINGLKRIRIGSLEPSFITSEFIKVVTSDERFCNHFHISLQSGCDETLKRMGRKYDTASFGRVVSMLKEKIADCAVTTDIITGFPGEMYGEFEESCRFIEKMEFSKIHVFKFSPRKGTPAYRMENQVDPLIKAERSEKILEISDKSALKFHTSLIGKKQMVLVEQYINGKQNYWSGHTSNYVQVFFKSEYNMENKYIEIKIKNAYTNHVEGEN